MREYHGRIRVFTNCYAFLVALYHIVYTSGLLTFFDIDIGGRHTGVSIGSVVALVFLFWPATKKSPKDRLPWYDALLCAFVLLPSSYYALNFQRILYAALTPNILEIVFGVILILAAFEAVRRTMGNALVIVGLFFLVYPPFAQFMPGIFSASPIRWSRLVGDIFMGTQGIFASTADTFATVIAIFVVFGSFIKNTKAGDFFLDINLALLGRFRGGAAKASVVSSALFGTVSGVAVANVMTTGSVSIPLMIKAGYEPEFAAAVSATASTGGAIMPPVMGILAFIMADYLGLPYWTIALAAIIPAILYYTGLYFQVDFHSARMGLEGLPKSSLPNTLSVFYRGWYYLLPLGVIIILFAVFGWSATRVGFWAFLSILFIAMIEAGVSRKLKVFGKMTVDTVRESSISLAAIMPAAMLAGIVMAAVSITGLGLRLSAGLVALANGNLFILLVLTAITSLVMGTFGDLIVVYLMLASLAAPALVVMGVPPLAAHFFILYYTVVGLITPPDCVPVYAAAAIAHSHPLKSGIASAKLGIAALIVPFVFVYNPGLLLIGQSGQIFLDGVLAIIGMVGVAAAIEGWLLSSTSRWERLALGVGGFILVLPGTWIKVAGAALLFLGTALQVRKRIAAKVVKAKGGIDVAVR
jgi:TRAP transporter 4TM/12TM fusion protein